MISRPGAYFVLIIALLSPCASLRAELRVGDSLPSLVPEMFDGSSPPTLEGNVVMIDFWASWCAPCKASFPAYGRLQKDLAPKGLVILAISVDQDKTAYAAFLRKQRPPFVVLHDKTQALVRTVKVPTMPTAYVFGRDGKLRFIHVGYHGDKTDAELRSQIETLLAETSAPP